MKKSFAMLFLTTVVGLAFAQEAAPTLSISSNDLLMEMKPALSVDEKITPKKGIVYLRMGVSDSYPADALKDTKMVPGIGLGYRLASGASAIDISGSYNRRYSHSDHGKRDTYYFTFPKANYLHYISPANDTSLYAGGGLAWAGMKTKDKREFLGLVPNVALGYEMNRNQNWKSFVQLDVSQPAVAAFSKGSFPGPLAEVSVGAGF